MSNDFDLMSNLPLIVFAVCFFIDFVIFVWAEVILLTAKGEMEKIEKGRGVLSMAFIILFLILLVIAVFYLITFVLQKGKVFQPEQVSAEFPPAFHIGALPSAPEFIKISDYYFVGPWPLKGSERIRDLAIMAALCKRGENYDVLYIGAESSGKLMNHAQYGCWAENCEGGAKNLHFAVFWTPYERYDPVEKGGIMANLIEKIDPVCFDK